MSTDELKAHLDLCFTLLEKTADRLKAHIESKQSRLISKTLQDLKLHFKDFKETFRKYLLKTKTDLNDSDKSELFSAAETIVADMDDIAVITLEDINNEETTSQRNMLESQRAEDLLRKKNRLQKEYEQEFAEVLQSLETLMNGLESEEMAVESNPVSEELEYLDQRFNKAVSINLECRDMEETTEGWESAQRNRHSAERDYRQKLLNVKGLLARKSRENSVMSHGHPSGSVMQSPRYDNHDHHANLVKPRRMDYPKFDGKIRHYNTFKRDFEEIVIKNNNYTEEQLSHILRNHCLTGKLQSDVRNIFDYKKIWEKLDEDCHDEEEVVEEITREIYDLKPIKEYDYSGFINLVDLVEQADCDLNAINVTNVLNNKMTLRVIETRCPDWVIKPWISSREDPQLEPVERGRDFNNFLKFLCEKRKEAKKLMRLQDNKKAQTLSQKDVPQKAKKATVLATAGEVVEAKEKHKPEKKKITCIVPGCKYQQRHFLSDCRTWKKLGATEKGQIVVENSLCVLCFNKSHSVEDCPKKDAGWKPCDVDNCGKWHSRTIHGAKASGLTLVIDSQAETRKNVLLLTQKIPVKGNFSCKTIWDSGSTTSIVTFDFAKQAQLKGVDCQFQISGVGGEVKMIDTKLYIVPLIDANGDSHEICAFGMQDITSYTTELCAEILSQDFQEISPSDLDFADGRMDLLVGMNHADLMPVQKTVQGRLVLYKSVFGTGYLVGGLHSARKKN